MEMRVQSPSRGFLYVDPYWAIYFHDGRGSIVGQNMVWFRNRRLDPRLNGGRTPNRARDLRSLRDVWTKQQFNQARREGKLVIRKRVRGVAPTPFFSNSGGMSGFAAEAGRIAQREFGQFVLRELGDDLNINGNIVIPIRAVR